MNNYKVREGYEFFEEAVMLPENSEITYKGVICLIVKMLMRDYRSLEAREWNGKKHSILTIYMEISINGKKQSHESKYDTGYPPEGMTVEQVVENIKSSSGIKLQEIDDPVFAGNATIITSPWSLKELIASYLDLFNYESL